MKFIERLAERAYQKISSDLTTFRAMLTGGVSEIFKAGFQCGFRRDLSDAAMDVLAERRRQIEEEGYTYGHDDYHSRGEMKPAAMAYISNSKSWWPWSNESWKPKDTRSNLVRAAALIIAEIERLDRMDEMQTIKEEEKAS